MSIGVVLTDEKVGEAHMLITTWTKSAPPLPPPPGQAVG